jgi:hypothetical protein
MKTFFILTFIACFSATLTLHAQDQKKYLYQSKIHSYTNMKNAGIGMTAGGAILSIIGISTMSSALNTDPDMETDEGLSKFTNGYLVTVLGVAVTGGGVTLWAIGGSKKRSYTEKLNALSLQLKPAPTQMLALSWRF